MYYGNIKNCNVADGPGVRVSLYVSGCRNACPGCQNKCTWNFYFGKEYTEETEQYILDLLKPEYITGFTLCGGEPFEEENQRVLVNLLKKVKALYPQKDIWSYSGYEYEDLISGGRKHCEVTDEILSMIDVLVVGKFLIEQRDISDNNRWRGSRNQRLIDVHKSIATNKKIYLAGIPNNN